MSLSLSIRNGLAAAGFALLASTALPDTEAAAQDEGPISTCLAVAHDIGTDLPVRYASAKPSDAPLLHASTDSKWDVTFAFQGHSTYLIESPGGIRVATDYAGWLTDRVTPDVVTMNNAHSTHFTMSPDPAIPHVLRGWPRNGDIARHNIEVGDVIVRNVTTDIIRYGTVPDGNSIFIFETGGLCIGHLGHLHHRLSEDHYRKIGRLDVVMVPVDGGLTMNHVSVKEILSRLRSSVILPMHVRSTGALPLFVRYMDGFPVETVATNRITFSLRTLPKQPTIYILAGVGAWAPPAWD